MKGWVDFRAVKQAVSMEAVLRHYQITELRRHREQLQGRCPIHRGERDDSFRASLSKNVFHCFACQAGGNVLDLVAALERCSIREAALHLQQWFGVSPAVEFQVASSHPVQPKGELVREKEGWNPPLRFALTGVDPSHPYLMQRGIDRVTAVEFGVGFYARPGLLRERIVIPIHNQQGDIVAYAGRSLDGRLPKYRLPVGFRKALELFNLYRAAGTGSKTVIVVEGYFDCMRVHQAGLPWVVALMGSSLAVEQERTLLQHFDRIVLMLDGDAAGRNASRTIAARLSGRCSLEVVHVPDGAQPDQLSPAAVRRLVENLATSGGEKCPGVWGSTAGWSAPNCSRNLE
jgi:DNA primase